MTPVVLPDLFLASAAQHADAAAIDVPPGAGRPQRQVVRYRELAAMAQAVRAALVGSLRRDALVLVLLPRTTPWLYAAQLGVQLGGAAHVCLDGAFPDTHLRHIATDAAVVAIVTDAVGAQRLARAGADAPRVIVPLPLPSAAAPPPLARSPELTDRDLAYAIYTSGTTGAPKGVLIEHRGIVNLIREGVARFGIGPGDRIAQGSSPAYDSSVEETWLAFAAGATVVVLDDDAVRLGPDLVAWLRRERVTVLCPPPTLLRAMACRAPRRELPELRLCYVGGEPLPQDLAAAWGSGIWLENGYGPTECTVTVVRGRIAPGEPVTIGTPVPPHMAFVCDAELRPVVDGEAGELCIGGPGLARGYLGRAALTAERFPTAPGLGRVYRTGDLVRRNADGRLEYLGRIDAQVKLRGYRIELGAIEAALARSPGVRAAACAVQGDEPERTLVAWIVPVAGEPPPSATVLQARLADELPAYMVPAHIGALAELPTTIGGKIDRSALPRWSRPTAAARAVAANGDPLRAAFAAVLGRDPHELGPADDFFAHGGDSLRAALLVSRLRQVPGCDGVTVRDVYQAPTIAALGERIAAHARHPRAGADPQAAGDAPADRGRPLAFTFGQCAFLGAQLLLGATFAYAVGFVAMPWLLATFTLPVILFVLPWCAPLLALGYAAVALWCTVAAKELLIGRYEPGSVSAWSGYRLRHWIVTSLARFVPWRLLAGTELHSAALRALGAKVGRRVFVSRGVDLSGGGWDLLELGDDVVLGRDVALGMCELDRGRLVLGRVAIGAGATLDTRAGTGPDVVVGPGAVIGPLAFVAPGTHVPAAESWTGVPAQAHGAAAQPARDPNAPSLSPWRGTLAVLAVRMVFAPLLAMPLALCAWIALDGFGVDAAAVTGWLCADGPLSQPGWYWLAVLLPMLGLGFGLLELALLLRWLPPVPAGTFACRSHRHAWLQQRSEWLELAGTWLSGTLFWPCWLRLAGMRVGRDVEISTITDTLPEHVAIGGGSFLADGVYLGVPVYRGGMVTVAPTQLGERTFVGNHVVIAAGERLPDDLLLGIATVADQRAMRAGSAWFGLPPFALPRREVVAVDRRLTHAPGFVRYTNRLCWEAARVLLPGVPVAIGLLWFALVATMSEHGAAVAWSMAVFGMLLSGAASAAVVVVAKWALLGRVRPGQHGLWSCWASRWDFVYVLWQRLARPVLAPLEGTLLLPWYLRAMGMRIGRRCVLGHGFAQVVDPDMLSLDDGATVHALFQAHSFEDRVLKIDRVHIGRDATVGCGAVLLYGATVGARAHVLPHSVVMKRELLLPGRSYAGAPTAEIEVAAAAAAHAAERTAPAAALAPPRRDEAFDVARGLAVLGMVWLHLVPLPPDDVVGATATAVRTSLAWLEGVPASLFVLLAGAAWFAPGARPWTWVARRSLALVACGLAFWQWVWPNDVMAPLGLMLPLVAAIHAGGRAALAFAIAGIAACVPAATELFGHYVATDALDDGTHVANHAFGAATARWFLFDGAYPLLPWLCLPLLGALLTQVRADAVRLWRWFALAVPLPFVATALAWIAVDHERELDGFGVHVAITWQPTSLPFVARCGGAAIAIVAGLAFVARRRGLPRWLGPLAAVGRASLTHYVAHIALVYAVLRRWWPAEDWPVHVGVLAAGCYGAVALASSSWWFHRMRRGPLEALLRALSGRARR